MPVGTVVDIAGTHGTWSCLFPHDVRLSAPRFHHGIAALARPRQRLTQAVDADRMGTLGKTVHGVPERVPQGGSVDQSGFVRVRLAPWAQRLAQDGMAGGFDPSRGFPPGKRAIEALDQLIGEAATEETRTLLLFTRHDVFL